MARRGAKRRGQRDKLILRPRALLEARRRPETREGRRIVQSLLDACSLEIERVGLERVTTNSITERAGVSVGSFYYYFPNKEAIVMELARECEGRVIARFEASLRDESARAKGANGAIRALLDASFEERARAPKTLRALALALPRSCSDAPSGEHEDGLPLALVRATPELSGLIRFVGAHASSGVFEEATLQDAPWASEPRFRSALCRLAEEFFASRELRFVPIDERAVEDLPEAWLRARPTSDKRDRTREAILEGMIDALREAGWSGVTARHVAAHAGVGASTIYRYFPNLRAIAVELARRREEDSFAQLRERLSDEEAEIGHVIHGAISTLIMLARHDIRVRQALIAEVPRHPLRPTSAIVDARLRAIIIDQLRHRNAEVDEASLEITSFITAHSVERVIEAAVLYRPALLSERSFARELERLAWIALAPALIERRSEPRSEVARAEHAPQSSDNAS